MKVNRQRSFSGAFPTRKPYFYLRKLRNKVEDNHFRGESSTRIEIIFTGKVESDESNRQNVINETKEGTADPAPAITTRVWNWFASIVKS
jgi:hypothetical protein